MAAFRHKRDAEIGAFIRTQSGYIASLEADHARARNKRTGDRSQGGRFSGTVCTDQSDDLAFFNVKCDVPAGGHLAVRQFKSVGGEEGAHWTSAPR